MCALGPPCEHSLFPPSQVAPRLPFERLRHTSPCHAPSCNTHARSTATCKHVTTPTPGIHHPAVPWRPRPCKAVPCSFTKRDTCAHTHHVTQHTHAPGPPSRLSAALAQALHPLHPWLPPPAYTHTWCVLLRRLLRLIPGGHGGGGSRRQPILVPPQAVLLGRLHLEGDGGAAGWGGGGLGGGRAAASAQQGRRGACSHVRRCREGMLQGQRGWPRRGESRRVGVAVAVQSAQHERRGWGARCGGGPRLL